MVLSVLPLYLLLRCDFPENRDSSIILIMIMPRGNREMVWKDLASDITGEAAPKHE
jgi:hypothetical protein